MRHPVLGVQMHIPCALGSANLYSNGNYIFVGGTEKTSCFVIDRCHELEKWNFSSFYLFDKKNLKIYRVPSKVSKDDAMIKCN